MTRYFVIAAVLIFFFDKVRLCAFFNGKVLGLNLFHFTNRRRRQKQENKFLNVMNNRLHKITKS